MLALAKICESLLPIAYAAAFGFYALGFFRKEEERSVRWTRPALIVALLIHSTLIYARTTYYGHCLVYSPFELMTLISFTVTLTYLVVELTTGERGTGMFFVALALLFQTVSSMFGPEAQSIPADSPLLNYTVGLHISAALFGYTAFTISAIYGGLYLMLYHQIRSNHFGAFYNRLPSLQLLERMSERAAAIGLVFLTVAIGIALLALPDILPSFRYDDPKLIATVVIWGIYLGAILARRFANLEGRKVMVLSLIGFFGTIFSLTVINFLMSDFHRFGR